MAYNGTPTTEGKVMSKTEIALAVVSLAGAALLMKKFVAANKETRQLDDQFKQNEAIINS